MSYVCILCMFCIVFSTCVGFDLVKRAEVTLCSWLGYNNNNGMFCWCRQLAMSAHENATPIRILHNAAGHLAGPARSLGAVLMGYLGQSPPDCIRCSCAFNLQNRICDDDNNNNNNNWSFLYGAILHKKWTHCNKLWSLLPMGTT